MGQWQVGDLAVKLIQHNANQLQVALQSCHRGNLSAVRNLDPLQHCSVMILFSLRQVKVPVCSLVYETLDCVFCVHAIHNCMPLEAGSTAVKRPCFLQRSILAEKEQEMVLELISHCLRAVS